jgi:hypothetical protein
MRLAPACARTNGWALTFSPHAHLETLLEPTVLALVSVMLIDGTIPVPPTRVCEVPPYTPFEEALAPCNKEHPNYVGFQSMGVYRRSEALWFRSELDSWILQIKPEWKSFSAERFSSAVSLLLYGSEDNRLVGYARFQVLTVASKKMVVFWVFKPLSVRRLPTFQRCLLPPSSVLDYAPYTCWMQPTLPFEPCSLPVLQCNHSHSLISRR